MYTHKVCISRLALGGEGGREGALIRPETYPPQVLDPVCLVRHLEHLHEKLVGREGLSAARETSEHKHPRLRGMGEVGQEQLSEPTKRHVRGRACRLV